MENKGKFKLWQVILAFVLGFLLAMGAIVAPGYTKQGRLERGVAKDMVEQVESVE